MFRPASSSASACLWNQLALRPWQSQIFACAAWICLVTSTLPNTSQSALDIVKLSSIPWFCQRCQAQLAACSLGDVCACCTGPLMRHVARSRSPPLSFRSTEERISFYSRAAQGHSYSQSPQWQSTQRSPRQRRHIQPSQQPLEEQSARPFKAAPQPIARRLVDHQHPDSHRISSPSRWGDSRQAQHFWSVPFASQRSHVRQQSSAFLQNARTQQPYAFLQNAQMQNCGQPRALPSNLTTFTPREFPFEDHAAQRPRQNLNPYERFTADNSDLRARNEGLEDHFRFNDQDQSHRARSISPVFEPRLQYPRYSPLSRNSQRSQDDLYIADHLSAARHRTDSWLPPSVHDPFVAHPPQRLHDDSYVTDYVPAPRSRPRFYLPPLVCDPFEALWVSRLSPETPGDYYASSPGSLYQTYSNADAHEVPTPPRHMPDADPSLEAFCPPTRFSSSFARLNSFQSTPAFDQESPLTSYDLTSGRWFSSQAHADLRGIGAQEQASSQQYAETTEPPAPSR